jgi:hypothetical protein
MKKNRPAIILIFFISYCLSGFILTSCSTNSSKERIILTRIHGTFQNINFVTGDSWRFPEEAQIVLLGNGKNGAEPEVLTTGFYSAAYPDVSYDGNFLLFAGQLKKEDPWRIWELNLGNLKTRAVTPAGGKCSDPVYLPGNRLVFTRSEENDSLKAMSSLFTCNLDGTDIRRITFSPCAYFASNVLKDGRILTAARQVFPEKGRHESVVMRPDGTKADLFYLPGQIASICSRQRETSDGRIVFAESAKGDGEDGSLIAVNYNRPLHTRINLSQDITGNFISVFPALSGKMLVCYRKSVSDSYGLYELDPRTKDIGQLVYKNNEYNVIDVVVADIHPRQRKLPSEVDMHVKTGLLLCQDINFLNPTESGKSSKKAVKIEILGPDRSLGIVNVEEDGSFYLKPLSDTPFRIQTLDENGKVVNGPCAWIYLRPNERRGCVGCHEDPELSPENRIPYSVKKNPVIVPIHIDKVKEKKVDLE